MAVVVVVMVNILKLFSPAGSRMHRWNKSKGGGWRGIHYNIAILKTLTATFHLIFSDFCLLCVGGVQIHIAIRRGNIQCLVYI